MKLIKSIVWLSASLLSLSCGNGGGGKKPVSPDTASRKLEDTIWTAHLDPPLDDSTMSVLDKLLPASDTSISDIVLTKQDVQFTAGIFFQIRNLNGREYGFGANLARKYRKILPFTEGEKKLFDLIINLAVKAHYLADRLHFNYPDEGPDKPAQKGLGYSWGAKEYKRRAKPPGEGDNCTYMIYGLDCSGFLYQLFLQNNLTIPDGPADNQRREATMSHTLKPYFNTDPFKVRDLGRLTVAEMRSGDIIYFRNLKTGQVAHIGMVFCDLSNHLSLYESRGSPGKCDSNISPVRGVLASTVDERIESEIREYAVVRITPL